MKQETFEIEAEYEGERLDKYLSVIFEQSESTSNAPSRSFFQKLIKDGHVTVNDPRKRQIIVCIWMILYVWKFPML